MLRRPPWLVVGAALILPASLYLTATLRFQRVGLFPAVLLLLAGRAIRFEKTRIGWLLVVSAAAFFGWLAWTM